MNKIFSTILFLIMIFNLNSINEKEIILNQARQYGFRQKFTRAIELYKIALEKYPQDEKIFESMLKMYIRADSTKTAEKILLKNKNKMDKFTFVNFEVQLLLKKGEFGKAEKIVLKFLDENPRKINAYSTFIRIFESANQTDFAIKLIYRARKLTDDKQMLAMSLARDLNLIGNYKKSIDEYFSYLKKHGSYKFYISSLVSKIAGKSKEKIKYLDNYSSDKNPAVQYVLAKTFFNINNFDKAFEHYKYTNLNEIKRFSDYLYKNGFYENAEEVNYYIIKNFSDRLTKAEANLVLAKIYVMQKKYDKAKDFIDKVLKEKYLYSKRIKYKTHVISESYLLLAKIAILENNDNRFLPYIQLAKNNTYYYADKAKLDFQEINFYYAKGKFSHADSLTAYLYKKYSRQSEIEDQLSPYIFISAFLKNTSEVDSLLTDVVLKQPENTNDMIKFYYYLKNSDTNEKNVFFKAYFMRKIFKKNTAVELIENLYKTTKKDFYLVTLIEWQRENSVEKINMSVGKSIKNTIFKNYFKYFCSDNNADKMKNFLNQNPNSFITPFIRMKYQKIIADSF